MAKMLSFMLCVFYCSLKKKEKEKVVILTWHSLRKSSWSPEKTWCVSSLMVAGRRSLSSYLHFWKLQVLGCFAHLNPRRTGFLPSLCGLLPWCSNTIVHRIPYTGFQHSIWLTAVCAFCFLGWFWGLSAFLGLEFHTKMQIMGYKYYHLLLVTTERGKALGSLKTNACRSCLLHLCSWHRHWWQARLKTGEGDTSSITNIFSKLIKVVQPVTGSPDHSIVTQPTISLLVYRVLPCSSGSEQSFEKAIVFCCLKYVFRAGW